MHSTLHEDQDVTEAKSEERSQRKLEVGELVWGAARGSPAWPGKVESLGPPGTMTVWVRWYGGGGGRSQVEVKALKSLSEGLEAHHRARKKFRKSRKLNMQLENAIQEAMAELDKATEPSNEPKSIAGSRSCRTTHGGGKGSEGGGAVSRQEGKRSSKKSVGSSNTVAAEQNECR